MSLAEPLDLNRVDPAIWHLLVCNTTYGPYTLGQLRSFVSEGRISPQSKIAAGDGAKFVAAADCPQLASAFTEYAEKQDRQRFANLVIVAKLSEDDRKLVAALNELGAFAQAMDSVFLLRSDKKLTDIRARLLSISAPDEKIMIIDASHDRLAWLGLDADADSHLRAVWNKAA